MLVFDRENWPHHRPWAISVLAATLAGLAWCLWHGFVRAPRAGWPSGGSFPGLTLGIAGGLLIVFAMLLWPRKALRRLRLGRTKTWMAAHLWLGLLTLPLLLLHGGFHFNPATSPLAAALMWLLVLVVASGLLGATLQNQIPRRMLDELPSETIHNQIPHVLAQYREQASRLVEATCGAPPTDTRPMASVEAVRSAGLVTGKTVISDTIPRAVPETRPLDLAYREHIGPFLTAEHAHDHALASPRRARAFFQDLTSRLPAEAHPVVDRLAGFCDQRRQFDLQRRLHRWLHAWLVVHVTLSVALTVLMFAHVYIALRYR